MKKHFNKIALAIAALTLCIGFSSCGDKNADRFKEAAMQLDNTTHTLEYEYDAWPDGGIRITGSHLASLISLGDLEKMLSCPLYVSGPHRDGEWDLYNWEDFGHYNPEAIQYLADLAEKVVSDKKFVQLSYPLVDKYLGRQMHIMMVLHDVVYDTEYMYEEEQRDYILGSIVENQGYTDEANFITGSFDLDDGTGVYDWYSYEMLYWWARRWADGSIDQFYDGLSTIYMAYYPDYVYDFYDYWNGGFWEEGEEFMETEYNCELEEDLPIAAKERIKEKDAIQMIQKAAADLDKSTNVLEGEFDYWPECGLRITGSHLFSLISLRTLNRMLPCDLYVSGPHYYNRWDLNNPWEYGRYNPEAIEYLNKLVTKVVADKKFVERTRPLVEKNLKRQMFILKSLYDGLNDPELCPDKEAVLENSLYSQGWCGEDEPSGQFLGTMSYLEDGSYVFGNTGNMFLYWWARRNDDGTMELFHQGLETIYNAYFTE